MKAIIKTLDTGLICTQTKQENGIILIEVKK